MRFGKIFLIVSLFLLGSFSYAQTDANSEILVKILKEIENLKKGQQDLAKQIQELKGNKSNPSGGNKSKSAVKNVPIGDSVVLGNPNAPITIIKWTDFQ